MASRSLLKLLRLGPRISCTGALSDPLDLDGAGKIAEAILTSLRPQKAARATSNSVAPSTCLPAFPFPAAYHDGGPASFALGCETSAILADALPRAGGDLKKAKSLVTQVFEEQMRPLQAISEELSKAHSLPYKGIDASVAPLGSAATHQIVRVVGIGPIW